MAKKPASKAKRRAAPRWKLVIKKRGDGKPVYQAKLVYKGITAISSSPTLRRREATKAITLADRAAVKKPGDFLTYDVVEEGGT